MIATSFFATRLAFFADAVAPPPSSCSFTSTLAQTIAFAVVAFLVLALVLAVPLFRGKKLKKQCACAASKEVMRVLDEREKAKRKAAEYRPELVDVDELPTISPELAQSLSSKR